ncbi:Tetratricopeptide-like helical [Penicillium italicum]|uniref:Tetratricopeptide-like helical n=1 Tax=Penicillium italicum TaxID=40296 RepID=A0A0A2L795_PENIT|nr:Tetratricopeptide-like helical [Penicillium italicum]
MSNDRIPAHLDTLGSTQDQFTSPAECDIDEAIRHSIVALQTAIDSALLETLGMQLDARYQRTQNPNDLNASVRCCQLATKTTSDSDYAARLDRLVKLLNARFYCPAQTLRCKTSDDQLSLRLDALESSSQTHDQPINPTGDVDEAVRLDFLALQAAVNPALLQNLGMQLDARYRQTQNPNELDTAVQCCQLATKTTSYADYAAHLNHLVGVFESRFQYLDQSRRRETSDDQLSPRLGALESSSHAQNQPTNPTGDVDEAFRLGFLALRAAVDPALLENLGMQLHIRYHLTEDIVDLNLAIDYSWLATKMITYDHPNYKMCLNLLAGLLDARFQSTGFLPDLDRAIQLTRTAQIGRTNQTDLVRYWFELGERLGRRFGSRGTIVDLNDAIWYLSLAVKETTEDSAFLVDLLVELAFNFNLRYETLTKIEDLESAISLHQRALQATDYQDELRLDCLRNLGSDLEARYRHIGEPSDLHGAIALAHIAISTMEAISPNYYLLRDCFYELGTKLGLLYEKTNTIDDLNEAIIWSRKAVGAIEARIEVFRHIEHLLTLRYKRTHQTKDSEEAAKWAEEAVKWEEAV